MGRDVLIRLWLCVQHLKHHSDDQFLIYEGKLYCDSCQSNCVPSIRDFFFLFFSALQSFLSEWEWMFAFDSRDKKNRHLELIVKGCYG